MFITVITTMGGGRGQGFFWFSGQNLLDFRNLFFFVTKIFAFVRGGEGGGFVGYIYWICW